MTNVINLRQFRKRKAREAKEAESAQNRLDHGRSKSDRLKDAEEKDRQNRTLDGQHLDPDGSEQT